MRCEGDMENPKHVEMTSHGSSDSEVQNSHVLDYDTSASQSADKRTRTNYGLSAHKLKIEEAVKDLLETLNSGQKVNVRAVSEARNIPYNTLRDHFKKSQGLMAPPRRTTFNYPMAEYKGPHAFEQRLQTVIAPEVAKPFVYDIRKRGRKPALPKLIEAQLKTFVVKMNSIGLAVDRTQLKQVAFKVAADLNLTDFKATDMWLAAFQPQARHGVILVHSSGLKRKSWRLADVPVYGSSSYTQVMTTRHDAGANGDAPTDSQDDQMTSSDKIERDAGEQSESGAGGEQHAVPGPRDTHIDEDDEDDDATLRLVMGLGDDEDENTEGQRLAPRVEGATVPSGNESAVGDDTSQPNTHPKLDETGSDATAVPPATSTVATPLSVQNYPSASYRSSNKLEHSPSHHVVPSDDILRQLSAVSFQAILREIQIFLDATAASGTNIPYRGIVGSEEDDDDSTAPHQQSVVVVDRVTMPPHLARVPPPAAPPPSAPTLGMLEHGQVGQQSQTHSGSGTAQTSLLSGMGSSRHPSMPVSNDRERSSSTLLAQRHPTYGLSLTDILPDIVNTVAADHMAAAHLATVVPGPSAGGPDDRVGEAKRTPAGYSQHEVSGTEEDVHGQQQPIRGQQHPDVRGERLGAMRQGELDENLLAQLAASGEHDSALRHYVHHQEQLHHRQQEIQQHQQSEAKRRKVSHNHSGEGDGGRVADNSTSSAIFTGGLASLMTVSEDTAPSSVGGLRVPVTAERRLPLPGEPAAYQIISSGALPDSSQGAPPRHRQLTHRPAGNEPHEYLYSHSVPGDAAQTSVDEMLREIDCSSADDIDAESSQQADHFGIAMI